MTTLVVRDIIWAAAWQNQQNDLCAQQRLRSAWASAQSDQSFRCGHEETFGPLLPNERTAKTLMRHRWAHKSFCWFCRAAAHFLRSCFQNTMMLNYDYDRKMSHIMINSKDLTTGLMTNTSVLNDYKNVSLAEVTILESLMVVRCWLNIPSRG